MKNALSALVEEGRDLTEHEAYQAMSEIMRAGLETGALSIHRLDEAVLKPLATGYRDVVPERLRDMIGNFFGNFGDERVDERRLDTQPHASGR